MVSKIFKAIFIIGVLLLVISPRIVWAKDGEGSDNNIIKDVLPYGLVATGAAGATTISINNGRRKKRQAGFKSMEKETIIKKDNPYLKTKE